MSAEKQTKKEDIKELLERFADSQTASQMAEDIRKGEDVLEQYKTPVPDNRLISEIKAQIAKTTQKHKKTAYYYRFIRKTMAAAAIFIVMTAVGIKLLEKNIQKKESTINSTFLTKVIWETDDIIQNDVELATLSEEIKDIEKDTLAVRLNENGTNGDTELLELELKLVDINGNFWKG